MAYGNKNRDLVFSVKNLAYSGPIPSLSKLMEKAPNVIDICQCKAFQGGYQYYLTTKVGHHPIELQVIKIIVCFYVKNC